MLLAAALVLTGCPDDAGDNNDNGDNNGDANGAPTEATKVQSATIDANTRSAHSVTLNWDLPTDTDGLLGFTVSEENHSGSLLTAQEVDQNTTEHEVTGLEPATEYEFTIATRYSDSGKNNSTTVTGTTLGIPTAATKVQNATSGAITINTITLNWDLSTDTDGLLGFTVSEENDSGSLLTAQEVDQNTTEHEVTGLAPATVYTFTIATRYIDSGKNNSTIIMAMTAVATQVQRVMLVAGETTSNSVTIAWEDPADTNGYTGVSISTAATVGDLTMDTPRMVAKNTNTLTISDLAAETMHTLVLTFATQYDAQGKSGSSDHTITGTTQSNRVTSVAVSAITSNSVNISWEDPEDTVGYTQVTISVATTVGDLTMDTPRTVPKDTNTLTISDLAAETMHTLVLTFVTQYDTQGKSGSSDHTIAGTTQSNRVTSVAVSAITRSTITLSWTEPEDTIQYSGVTITAAPNITVMEDTPATTATITGLTAGTTYMFTITTRYQGSKAGADAETPITVSSLPAIDADGDTLIDIISLERLNNIRYNLDLMDGRYKTSTDDAGVQCGTAEDTPCIGYELTRNLDFTNAGSYDSGVVNTIWRPNTSDSATATNAGWAPIGSCNNDTTDGDSLPCGDEDDTPFAARFEGNGYTISNLYARNINDSAAAAIGLFGIVNNSATINTVGVVAASVYGSGAHSDYIGGLVGFSEGAITASYATGSTADGGMGGDIVGGLTGSNSGTIAASYVSGSTVDGGANNDNVGGLVGSNSNTIAASYVSGSTVDGGANNDNVGGLVGSNSNTIAASYVSGSTVDGGANNDNVGGLVGSNSHSTIIASYATDSTADGGADNDRVGGLVGNNFQNGFIIASYATAAADGGTGSGDRVGSLVGINTFTAGSFTINGTITASYGFGSTDNIDTAGDSGSSRPNGVTTAAHLTASGSTAVPGIWNQSGSNTASAWHFGTTSQIPALRYADYDGSGNGTYGCGSSSIATAVIPSSVPNGTGGTRTVNCGTTLLPGQR